MGAFIMTARLFTVEQEAEICEQYIAGLSDYDIAERWGCSQPTVSKIRKRYEVPTRSGSEQYALSTKKQIRLKANRLFTSEEERLIVQQYLLGMNDVDIANYWGCGTCTIGRIRRRFSVKTRSIAEQYATSQKWQASAEAKKLFTLEEEKLICQQYLSGLSEVEIAERWGCSQVTIGNIRRRHGAETRHRMSAGDFLTDVLLSTGRHAFERVCFFYAYSMVNYSHLLKPGIAFDHKARAGQSLGHYGDLLLLAEFDSRAEALAVEQAILNDTKAYAVCPPELLEWAGASELRQMPLQVLEEILVYYQGELTELGIKEFIRAYWPGAAEETLLESWEPRQYNEKVPTQEDL